MKYRKLRIAWSVGCGILCLLLIVLWVRSCWWVEAIRIPIQTSRGVIQIVSIPGLFGIGEIRPRRQEPFYRQSVFEWRDIFTRKSNPPVFPSHLRGGWMHTKNVDQIFLPYWLLISSFGVIATAPWIHWSERFSLRTLLIAITLVSLILGTFIWLSQQY
jgi:hypothetical protein